MISDQIKEKNCQIKVNIKRPWVCTETVLVLIIGSSKLRPVRENGDAFTDFVVF